MVTPSDDQYCSHRNHILLRIINEEKLIRKSQLLLMMGYGF